jgi:hypothetical protein
LPASVTEKPSSIFAKRTERSAVAAARVFRDRRAFAGAVGAAFAAAARRDRGASTRRAAVELPIDLDQDRVARAAHALLGGAIEATRTRATGAPSGAVALSTPTPLTGASMSATACRRARPA